MEGARPGLVLDAPAPHGAAHLWPTAVRVGSACPGDSAPSEAPSRTKPALLAFSPLCVELSFPPPHLPCSGITLGDSLKSRSS